MRISLKVLAAITAVFFACARPPALGSTEPDHASFNKPDGGTPQVELTLENARFDGQDLAGRFLVGVVNGHLRLDKRIIAGHTVAVADVTDCVSGQPLDFVVMDFYSRPLREGDILELAPGYWYGKEVRIPLFDKRLADLQKNSECVLVKLVFRAHGAPPMASLSVRAVREVPPVSDAGGPPHFEASMDGGT
jgi:hypothetical protein